MMLMSLWQVRLHGHNHGRWLRFGWLKTFSGYRMNGLDFCKLIDSGTQPAITFTGAITEQEVFLNPGMRGRVVSANIAQGMDEFIHVYVDLSEFADYNRQIAPDNCAKFGDFWIAPDIEIEPFEIVEDFRIALFQGYAQSGSENSYTEWLEDFVRGAQEASLEAGRESA